MIQLTQHNYGHKININIKDAKGNPVILDGCTVEMDLVYPNRTKQRFPLTIIDSVNGKVQITVIAEMLQYPNVSRGYIDVINSLSEITLQDSIMFYVNPADGGV